MKINELFIYLAVWTGLIATIANSYYTLLMLDRQLDINLATLESWESSVVIMEALKQAGQTNDAAVLRSKANCLSLESTIYQVRKSIRETEHSLSTLLGREAQGIERGVLANQNFPETMTVGIPLQLVANRPDVRQAEYKLAQSFYATNAARSAFYPTLKLSGAAGWTNSGGGVISNPGDWLWNAVGSLLQPLFNRGTNQANLKIAKAQQEEAKLLFQQSLLDAGQEVNDALMQWQTSKERISLGEKQVETLLDAVSKTELLMKHSSVNYLEVLTAQQALLNAEQSQVQNNFEKIQGIVNLYRALGGGV